MEEEKMKKGFLVGLSIAVMLLAVGCAGGKKEQDVYKRQIRISLWYRSNNC